jgi:hypothetical protein
LAPIVYDRTRLTILLERHDEVAEYVLAVATVDKVAARI